METDKERDRERKREREKKEEKVGKKDRDREGVVCVERVRKIGRQGERAEGRGRTRERWMEQW